MSVHRRFIVCAALAALTPLVACGRSMTTDPTTGLPGPAVSDAAPLTLLAPAQGEEIRQNDPTLGCDYVANRGFGFAAHFVWTPLVGEGPARYHLYVKGANAQYPWLDLTTAETEYAVTDCNSFVIDVNRAQWFWVVEALDSEDRVVAVSDTGRFAFEPCRLSNGRPCSAPASLAISGVVATRED